VSGSGQALKEALHHHHHPPPRRGVGGRVAGAAGIRRTGNRPLARLILDTSVLIDAERAGVDSLEVAIGDEDNVAVAAITAAELLVGVELAEGERRARRREFVEAVLDSISVEDYDLDVATAHAALLAHARRAGRPRGAQDLIIAATARAREREVFSIDEEGFAELPGVTLRAA
jgi:tRNA(fMet)-specific endonuclease VapC